MEIFRLTTPSIHPPTRPSILAPELRAEAATFDLTCLATSVPYENNFFFESVGNSVILSFNGWNILTYLPISNGLVYFIALLILRKLGIGSAHDDRTAQHGSLAGGCRSTQAGREPDRALAGLGPIPAPGGDGRGLKP